MALPSPDKPDINDKYSTIRADILANCTYLDIPQSRYVFSSLPTIAAGDVLGVGGTANVTVTGVGFKPSYIMFIAIGEGGPRSFGLYGLSTMPYSQFCYDRRIDLTATNTIQNNLNVQRVVNLYTKGVGYVNSVYGVITSLNNDGYVYAWYEPYADTLDNYKVFSLSIR